MQRKKTAAKGGGRLIGIGNDREALAGAGSIVGLSPHNSAQSVCSVVENTASSVRDILANCGHPIEEIIRHVLIPKLHAKKTKFFFTDGKVEARVVDDHHVQLKTALELAKMCGCYAAENVEMNIDQTTPIDMRELSDDDLRAFLKITARFRTGDSAGER